MPCPRRTTTRRVAALAFAMALTATAAVVRAEDFYARKSVSLLIGFGPGGGYDLYARLVARHLGRHVPGSPTIVPQNMPGAAGLKVANYMHQAAPQDGTALAMAAEAVALEQALGGVGTDYDSGRFGWVGRVAASASITFSWHTSKVKTVDDARRLEMLLGASGATGITSYTPRALNRLADTRFKLVTGYTGSAAVFLALERGEVEGGFAIWPELKQQKPDWLQDKRINILYIVAGKRAADLPDIPTTGELGTTAEARDVLSFLASTAEIGRSLFTTGGVPAARLALLRAAFTAMIADAEFRQDADRSGLRIDALSGEAMQTLVAGVVGSPRTLIEKAKAARN